MMAHYGPLLFSAYMSSNLSCSACTLDVFCPVSCGPRTKIHTAHKATSTAEAEDSTGLLEHIALTVRWEDSKPWGYQST